MRIRGRDEWVWALVMIRDLGGMRLECEVRVGGMGLGLAIEFGDGFEGEDARMDNLGDGLEREGVGLNEVDGFGPGPRIEGGMREGERWMIE